MILDTSGLSVLAEGEPPLDAFLRKAAQVATPVIVLGVNTDMEFRIHATGSNRNSGSANTCRAFEFWMSTSGPPFPTALFEQT